jgi:fluoroacetyl-CoA thioesterase
MPATIGLTGSAVHVVDDVDTAVALGSGDVPVLATPRLLAWCEAATVEALDGSLSDDETSVGTRVELVHASASAVGERITTTATVVAVDGRLVRYDVAATTEAGALVAHGSVTRVVVDRQRFLARLDRASGGP